MNNRLIFVIPVRGGSRRIPRKNMLMLGGESLIARKVRQVCGLGMVVVGSDDDEMLAEAEKSGAIAVRRTKTNEGQDSANSMWKEFMELIEPLNPKTVVWTHVTSPFIKTETYEKAIKTFDIARQEGYDSLISVTAVREHFWCNDMRTPMYNVTWCKNVRHLCADELPPIYMQNGGLFINDYQQVRQHPYFFGERPKLFEIPKEESIDINTPEDWICCKALYEHYNNPQ